ncbi:MAG: hypothetical protein C0626_11085 [Arcobacter sp.]|uniref:hypothetical protein n=1 Tax=uncultured Arcobacter sp. TaxID=165434 RepID=UPI000CAAA4F0|nr:hypothetical protein [uncultured Arcobacter sp.]PLY09507.1 MAG: hypothetical protein C0626_11085 [Arcobacter sp.]
MIKNLLLISLFISNLYSQNISWYSNYDKALILAQNEKKNLFVLLVDEKEESKKLLANLYKKKEFVNLLNKRFISILININYKISYPIELYYTTRFPTIFIVDSKLELVLKEPIYNINSLEELKLF